MVSNGLNEVKQYEPSLRLLSVKLSSAIIAGALLLQIAGSAIASKASDLAKQAQAAEADHQISQAYLLYSQAAALDSGNRKYRAHAEALRTRASLASNAYPVDFEPADLPPDPVPYFDNLTARELAASGNIQPAPELHAAPGRIDIDLNDNYRALFEKVAKLYKLDCVFDSDYEPGRRILFRLTQVDYREALFSLSQATNSFIIPVSGTVFLVAKDTPQKRADLEQTMSVIVPVPQALTSQELIEVAQLVRQATGVEKLAWDTKSDSIVMRDRVSRVIPAQALLQNLFAYRPQVMIELQLIQVTKSDMLNYGISLPNVFNIAFTGIGLNTTNSSAVLPASTSNPFPYNSRTFNFVSVATQGGTGIVQNLLRGLYPTSLSLYSIGIQEAAAMLNFSASRGRTILTSQLRSLDGQAATFHLGERYPILTGSYAVGAAVGASYVPTPSFTFEDLGINLKVTPRIHGIKSVSLDVETEFKILSGAMNLGNPIIGNQKMKSMVDLEEDEWAVIAGLTQDSVSRTTNGTFGVSQIPILGKLLDQTAKDKEKSEVLILMRPHLLNLPGGENVTKDVRVGSETRPYLPI